MFLCFIFEENRYKGLYYFGIECWFNKDVYLLDF